MKHYLVIITLLIPTTFVVAQEASTFSIGPRVGINFSTLTNTDEAEFKPGLVAGLTSTYSINEKRVLLLTPCIRRRAVNMI
ncbi:MAG: hypothetical protein IPJ74_19080 [Saprospiraceae bacterium]|nr:hypothetical protein [Saprospiraceae bacterium]